jgi:hypothetical protein
MGQRSMVTFDGDTNDDVRLWHSYLYWARERVRALSADPMVGAPATAASVDAAIVDDPHNRIDNSTGVALQALVFTAFALEYRLKRVLRAMGVSVPPKETLGPCLGNFWRRLAGVTRLDGTGPCRPPADWAKVEPLLRELRDRRNSLAHANYSETLSFLAASSDPAKEAIRLYNGVVEAIKLINLGTGYETRPTDKVDEYFRSLLA